MFPLRKNALNVTGIVSGKTSCSDSGGVNSGNSATCRWVRRICTVFWDSEMNTDHGMICRTEGAGSLIIMNKINGTFVCKNVIYTRTFPLMTRWIPANICRSCATCIHHWSFRVPRLQQSTIFNSQVEISKY